VALRRAGRDADALKKLQGASDLDPTPRSAAQLGLCLQALGRWSDADGKLAEAISATDDPWIRKNRATLKDSLETVKTHVARVEVLGQPVGAEVFVNGRRVGTLPLADAVPVNEGLVDIEVRAAGFENEQRTVTMVGGAYQSLVVRLKSVANAQVTAPAGVPDHSGGAIGLSAKSQDSSREEPRPLLKRPWFWIGVGAVVVGAVAAAVVLSAPGDKSPRFTDTGEL
jgi:hypothetical protein